MSAPSVAPVQPASCGQVTLIRVAGADVAVRRMGKGPLVVCAHAIGHDSRDFDALAARLGHAFEFVMIDWPGQGNSPPDDGGVSSQRYGEILTEVLSVLDLQGVILLGNSIGGGACIVATARQSQRVRGLVLCNTAGLASTGLIARIFCRNKAKFFEQAERRVADFPQKFRSYYEKLVLPGPPAAQRREEIIATAMKVGPIIRQAWLSFTKPESSLRSLASGITCPVLIAWAKDDRVNRWLFSKAGVQKFPRRRIEMLPGGHSAFLEAPAEFDAVFRNWEASLPA
jgi:pimeloyl-ACP methyl ester carboxylesterase